MQAPTSTQIVQPIIRLATPEDREAIYRLRHQIFANELGQHENNDTGQLSDSLDAVNIYIIITFKEKLIGCISITPPGDLGYSVDKYFSRADIDVPFDSGLFELRLLAVDEYWRISRLATGLMYAALRWLSVHGATHIVALGRVGRPSSLYEKLGLERTNKSVQSGMVTYELMTAGLGRLLNITASRTELVQYLECHFEWELPFEIHQPQACYHGGASITALGDTFEDLGSSKQIVTADVLDAWYPPAPGVLEAITSDLPRLLKTSPPTTCGGLLRQIASSRKIPYSGLVPGAGSSDLIFRAFTHLLPDEARVLILDPTYGEYAFATDQLKSCRVDRIQLSAKNDYAVDPSSLDPSILKSYDLVILVNPNSPTGQFLDTEHILDSIRATKGSTLFWVDETYIDYVGSSHSLERLAPSLDNLIVCKTMSKCYALSGARVGYLSTSAQRASQLKLVTPPWVVGHIGQIAGIQALKDPEYYERMYAQTAENRHELVVLIQSLPGVESVLEGVANFIVVHLEAAAPSAETVASRCRKEGVFLREFGNMTLHEETQALRIAVRSQEENLHVYEVLRQAILEKIETCRT